MVGEVKRVLWGVSVCCKVDKGGGLPWVADVGGVEDAAPVGGEVVAGDGEVAGTGDGGGHGEVWELGEVVGGGCWRFGGEKILSVGPCSGCPTNPGGRVNSLGRQLLNPTVSFLYHGGCFEKRPLHIKDCPQRNKWANMTEPTERRYNLTVTSRKKPID